MPKVVSESPLSRMFDKDSMKSKALNPIEKKIDAQKDKVDVSNNLISALNKLDGLVGNLQSSLGDLTNPILSPFETTTTKISTADIGKAEEFIDVSTRPGVAKRQYEVEVTRLAKSAFVILDAGGVNFNTAAPNLNGNMTIRLNDGVVDSDINIVFDGTEANIAEVLSKINWQLQQNGDEFEAFAMNVGAGEAKIEIKAKEGVTKNISMQPYVNNGGGATNITESLSETFVQACIEIDGVHFHSNSNKFEEVLDGITINASKVNQLGVKQTVKTGVADSAAFDNLFRNKFAPAINSLLAFMQEQKIDEPEPGEETPLSNEVVIMGQVDDMINRLIGVNGGLFADMGIGLQTATDPNLPPGTKLIDIIDVKKYEESLKDLDKLKDRFITNTKITLPANTGNATLSPVKMLAEMESKNSFPAFYNGKDFTLAVDLDGAGAVTGVTAAMHNGTTINGVYDAVKKQITFENTELEALSLNFDPNGENGKTINFTLNHTEGHINSVIKRANALKNYEDKGAISSAINKAKETLNTKKATLDKLQKWYDREQDRLDRQFSAISQIDMMAEIMSDAIADLLNPAA